MDAQQPPAFYSIPSDGATSISGIQLSPHLNIAGQVSINLKDGSIKYEPGYSPDAAAQQFWEAMSAEYREMLRWKAEHPKP